MTSLSIKLLASAVLAWATLSGFALAASTDEKTAPQRPGETQPVEKPGNTFEPEEPHDWWSGKWASGDWGGARTELERRGMIFEFTYTGEVRSNFAGGISTNDSTKYLQNVNASFDFFTEKFGLYSGGEFYVRYEGVAGKGISKDYVGDVQLISSIDAPPFNQISEFFYRHSILDDHLHFKIGKQDGTGDFIALKYGVDFTHSAFGCMSNIPIPRFPNDGLAAVVSYDAASWFSFATGVYDDRSTGRTTGFDTTLEKPFHEFSILELTFKPRFAPELPGWYRFGTWHERRDLPLVGVVATTVLPPGRPPRPPTTESVPRPFKHDFGGYFDFDQLVYRFSAKPDEDRGVGIFGQYSWTPEDRNETPVYFGGGIRCKGFLDARSADAIGVGFASVIFAEKLKRNEGKTQETAIEFFYKVQATPFMFFQPDFQYILKPGGNQRDAVTGGIRFQVAF
jgi:porin